MIAEVRIGAIQILGFFTMLPICSIEVPMPWETRPPKPFSGKDRKAKPIIWAQHPATAAPPARPVSPSAAQIAAEEIGSVSAMPTSTETTIPMRSGWSSVARMMMPPKAEATLPRNGARTAESAQPMTIVTIGVTRMSTLVSFETALPNSAAMMAMNSTARGPPAPPSWFAACPTAARENRTSGGACRA